MNNKVTHRKTSRGDLRLRSPGFLFSEGRWMSREEGYQVRPERLEDHFTYLNDTGSHASHE